MRLSARHQIRISLTLLVLTFALPAFAQEPVGCDKFKWPLESERAALISAKGVASGAEIAPSAAAKLSLAPIADAKLPQEPTRKPKDGTFAGFVRVAAPSKAGTYKVTMSKGGWIDVFQDGREVKSGAFSGATGCEGVRKSVKFNLTATPVLLVITGAPDTEIGVILTAE
jgi:hypothetical protein